MAPVSGYCKSQGERKELQGIVQSIVVLSTTTLFLSFLLLVLLLLMVTCTNQTPPSILKHKTTCLTEQKQKSGDLI